MTRRGLRGATVARLASLSALGLVGLGLTSWAAVASQQEATFPHEQHEGLFPLCTGCHEGIPRGDAPSSFPDPAACARCHDGVDLDRVGWNGRHTAADNLLFEHPEHAAALEREGDPDQVCAGCHIPAGGERMSVSTDIQTGTCFSCHEHRAEEHYVDAACDVCHVPLARTGFSLVRIEGLPTPTDHDRGSFLGEDHGTLAATDARRCATCHTSNRCVACHVDTDRASIRSVPSAPEGMELPLVAASYPEPGTHGDDGWLAEHGTQATLKTCGTCHTSNDCQACHVAEEPPVVATLTARSLGAAPGVGLTPRQPGSHEAFFFMTTHSALAASDPGTCQTCHREAFCVECHEGPSDGGYHPQGFVARHSAASFGRSADCATCHSTQAFCRACHEESGLAGFDRLGPDYHEGGPFWLIRHGQAARQNLESCASCHAQTDCTTCHSTVGAFKVNPHSRDFDAEAAFARSPRTCAACHLGNPLIGN